MATSDRYWWTGNLDDCQEGNDTAPDPSNDEPCLAHHSLRFEVESVASAEGRPMRTQAPVVMPASPFLPPGVSVDLPTALNDRLFVAQDDGLHFYPDLNLRRMSADTCN